MTHRVVVTGIGVVAPGGIGKDAFWHTLASGMSASDLVMIERRERLRSQMAAAIDWDPRHHGLTDEIIKRTNRHTEFALVAANEAWTDSFLDSDMLDKTRLGVVVGTAIGSTVRLEQEYQVVSKGATQYVVDPTCASPFLYHAMSPSSVSAELAAHFHARGPVLTVSTGCTAGVDAIAHAFEWIRDGDADVVVAGASEAGICAVNMASFDAIKATSARNNEPRTASRPFDRSRDGFVLGEGAAILILEKLEYAQKRQAYIYAEITGYGSALNAYHMTGLQRDGEDMVQAIEAALADAALEPTAIQYINAHGSSTQQNDIHETNAFKRVWGAEAYHIPVSSIKSMVGHSLGAIGAIEIAASVLTIQHSTIPPTINYQVPDPDCDLDYVPNRAREQHVDVIISTASGFGGFQSALVLTRFRPEEGDGNV